MISETRQRLIQLLADGEFRSGEWLAEHLGLSRAAIHNNIEALAELGLEIYRVKGKGYRLERPLSLLDGAVVNQQRQAPLHLFWQIDSTNAYLMKRKHLCTNGEACLAEMQTAGRGRRGREWVSPLACHIYLSYFHRLEQGMAAAAGLSLAVGVMLVEALEQAGFDGVGLKWPNDLYLDNKKLAGILVELNGQFGEPAEVVVGCGVNVSMPSGVATAIDQPWQELQFLQEGLIDRSRLASTILRHLDAGLTEFEHSGLAPFVVRWQQRDQFAGRAVKLLVGENTIRGTAAGIDLQGNLLLNIDGEIKAFAAGEISMRAD
ncbi:bifunctional biotin--[acetyl-CoA-carboxylase] ligase/biotin operon repressor BirA [Ferrimonas lipolytica]|uniref:Bifunctional ligase/repressor BirA n=1 Tax=Ferrimonas lipolytica TaxID=2724191 RepID=A0A6H1UIH4_9GAMM|nr:bifunctional biotin--[acetyl-CoA-carboxylase] ligase/biotin operon repressor BirA [Ferrimonas lipolytica]QIZ78429.1 bifunctional biotin--[acetyl-CoA-carboxylase] ligase/biotin operon repressor BirA [Ferrimonas lipolytica]